MKLVLQMIRAESGERSPPMMGTREQLTALLTASLETLGPDMLVLVLGQMNNDELEVGQHPIMRLDNYLNLQQEEAA